MNARGERSLLVALGCGLAIFLVVLTAVVARSRHVAWEPVVATVEPQPRPVQREVLTMLEATPSTSTRCEPVDPSSAIVVFDASETAHPVSGLVLDVHGKAVVGAKIAAVSWFEDDDIRALTVQTPTQTLSGPDGGFVLFLPDLGPQRIRVQATNWPALETTLDARGAAWVLRLPAGGTLRGRVVEAGIPVCSARVRISAAAEGAITIVPTDAFGNYAFERIPEGIRFLEVARAGQDFVSGEAESKRVDVLEGSVQEIELELGPALSFDVRGTVTVDGRRSQRGLVRAIKRFDGTASPQCERAAQVDESGRFVLTALPCGSYRVVVSLYTAAGGAFPFEVSLEVRGAESAYLDIDAVLGSLEGQVHGLDPTESVAGLGLVVQRLCDMTWTDVGPRFDDSVTTDENGRFRIDGLLTGEYRILLPRVGGGFERATSAPVLLRAGEGMLVEFLLPPQSQSSPAILRPTDGGL